MLNNNFYIIISLFLLMTSCGSNVRSAYDYNNIISNEEIIATESVYRFKAAIENQKHVELQRLKEEGVSNINRCKENLKGIDDFKGSDEYKNAAIYLLDIYLDIFENEFSSIIELYKQNNDLISGNTYSQVIKIDKQTDKKIEKALNNLKKRQLDFAENNNLMVAKGD